MATVSDQVSTVRNPGARGRSPYYVQNEIDIATAVATKGTALASADIIQCISIPANTLIMDAGIECTEVHTGTSSDTGFDLGVTGNNPDAFVDAFSFDGAAVGDYAANAGNGGCTVAAADTLDIVFTAMTGTALTGKMRVFAWLANIDDIGELDANEVTRDTLA
jgi:hypothetical protein|tara:strand:- start:828 stop:1319 length:492 start_codon:yes stop_codon:yes gene_type:complete